MDDAAPLVLQEKGDFGNALGPVLAYQYADRKTWRKVWTAKHLRLATIVDSSRDSFDSFPDPSHVFLETLA
jgi:hypothetical protein